MQIILNILIIFILINTLLKISFWKLWQVVVFILLVVSFVFMIYPFAIEQSQTTMNTKLEDSRVLGNMAVLVTLESALFLFYCFFAIQDFFTEKSTRRKIILQFYPGLLIFPVLFYLLTQVFFTFTGTDFQEASILFSVVLILFVFGGYFLFRLLIPEQDLRLEIQFLVSLFVTILGLIATSSGEMVYLPHSQPFDFKMLVYTALLFITLSSIGFFLNRICWRFFKPKL